MNLKCVGSMLRTITIIRPTDSHWSLHSDRSPFVHTTNNIIVGTGSTHSCTFNFVVFFFVMFIDVCKHTCPSTQR